MVFPTIEFGLFFAVVLALSWLLMPRQRIWKPFVLLASYAFYGYTDARWVLLLVGATVANQLGALGIARARALARPRLGRAVLTATIVADLGVLGLFKYYGFFVSSVADVLDRGGLRADLPLLNVALPVGISFFTFQALSYVLDVHRGELEPAGWMDTAVYLAFFPHLVAGPIVRAKEFLPQLTRARTSRDVDVARAVLLIIGGLVKKVLLADVLAGGLVDPVFAVPGAHSGWEVAAAIYGYAAQIFLDFSAYTDIATGVALLMGFTFPRNFDRPYAARSLQEFWRRWHMSLSRWLRDYLYRPLGGNRVGRVRLAANLLITMLLGGLWHGAAWTFVLWGAVHGSGLVIERAVRGWWTRRAAGRAAAAAAAGEGPWPVVPRPALELPVPRQPLLAQPELPSLVHLVPRGPAGPIPALAPLLPPPPSQAVLTRTAGGSVVSVAAARAAVLPQPVPAAASVPAVPAVPTESRPTTRRIAGVLGWLVTFHVVCLAWLLFRAPDLGTVGALLGRLTVGGAAPLVTPAVVAAVVIALGLQAVPESWHDRLRGLVAATPPVAVGALAGLSLVVVDVLAPERGVAAFIYFRF